MAETMRDLFLFIKSRKKYWLIPIILSMLLLASLFLVAESSVMGPFVYTLF